MPELKRNFTQGRMNKDLDERMVPNGEYRDALNVEVNTSEGSNVGTIQTLKGNTDINTGTILSDLTADTKLFSDEAVCVGTIADEKSNKLYWFVTDPKRNYDASWETGSSSLNNTYSHAEQDGSGTVSVVHKVYSDYILEYDENTNKSSWVVVEHVKVKTTITNDAHGDGDHLHVSNLGTAGDIRPVGIQVGMDVEINGMKTSIIKIEEDNTGSWNGWRVYTEHDATDNGYSGLGNVVAGDSVIFKQPFLKRALAFNHFASKKKGSIITGINIIDNLLFWTDNLTEPKKINIDRCKYGSRQADGPGKGFPLTGTRKYPTLLIVNGQIPDNSTNGRLGPLATYESAINYPFLGYKHTTVIKKSPTTPLRLTMSNTTREDVHGDGRVVINGTVNIPTPSSGDDLFFNEEGMLFGYGTENTNYPVTFPQEMDWQVGDLIEWFAEDDDAGFQDSPIAILEVASVDGTGTIFTFIIRTLSAGMIKSYRDFKVKLQQADPLFEFKFPRFAYRWKYEDGEYSCYSPFSEVAFLPEEFDYLPKKGYNLGMTNNLRYLLLSGFKPRTTPLDVVEIDILYKESNSPNVYTVDTIKSPSTKVSSLNTSNFSSDKANAWFGRIEQPTGWKEGPNTLTESATPILVSKSEFFRSWVIDSGVYYYVLDNHFSGIDIKIGDSITFLDNNGNADAVTLAAFEAATGQTGTIKVAGMLNNQPHPIDIGAKTTAISLTHNGVAVTSTSNTWLNDNDPLYLPPTNDDLDGVNIGIFRTVPETPAIYLDDPQGSFEVTTDMIHATLPANQLLRPWDNVPRKALAQEITGNRVVYGNYIQNYDLIGGDGNEDTLTKFTWSITRRLNIRDNIRYNSSTALRNPNTGATIKWYESLNAIKPISRLPERSLKSIRDYQLGVVYMDEFGRQTPVQTSESGLFRVPKSYADDYNTLRAKLDDVNVPSWASHFKFYLKENANEYYNLAMDRFYPAEDGNIWLSFPSSERNKVDEETFLILKKTHDGDTFVKEKARYKIIAIENEAPIFIKTKYNSFGIIAISDWGSSDGPIIGNKFVEVKDDLFDNSSFSGAMDKSNRVVRIHGPSAVSRWYDVSAIADTGAYTRVSVLKSFGPDMAFTTDDGTADGDLITTGLSIEIAWKEVKNLPEFGGRFFVKIFKDSTFEKYISTGSADADYVTKLAVPLGYAYNLQRTRQVWQDGEMGSTNPDNSKFFFVDENKSDGVHQDNLEPYAPGIDNTHAEKHGEGWRTTPVAGGGWASDRTENTIDISYHWISGDKNNHWSLTNGLDPGVTDQHIAVHHQFMTGGNLFRFRGDTTIYQITYCKPRALENYDSKPSRWDDGAWYGDASNHRVKYRIEFWPKLGTTGKDAIGRDATGYNPFYENAEGTDPNNPGAALTGQDWYPVEMCGSGTYGCYGMREHPDRQRTIEFVEQAISDESYSSDNPAIWETEPKENIDVDLYNEASEAIPIKQEWNTYYNRFEVDPKETWWHVFKYYNCFSFANGVESNRIRDDFNAVMVDKGPKASTVLAEQYKEERRGSGLIYSGIYNSTTGINRLNQFIQAEKITKDLNPTYGSIQKLWSKDTNLTTLCEDRVIGVQANKDALYNADGNVNVVASNRVLGDAKPFAGDFGISTNPESFAIDQYRAYFSDKSRGAVLRMSQNGLTPISDLGMRDYFKDAFRAKDITLKGSYDDVKRLYNLTIQSSDQDNLGNTNEDDNALVSLNPGGIPTQANYLGLWFRYGGVVDNWAMYMESGGTQGATNWPLLTQHVVGQTGTVTRGWTGIGPGGTNNPSSLPGGATEGWYGANPGLTNPIKIWVNKMTTGYGWRPTIDATSNFDALINALNTHGPNNVYLYQNFAYADTPIYNPLLGGSGINSLSNWPYSWYGPTGVATSGSGFAQHQPEAVYSIQSISYDAALEAYELEINWLVGYSGYQDVQVFKWSLDGPFEETNTSNMGANDALNADTSGLVNITASFSEDSKGWTSFKSWLQECGLSMNDKYFTFNRGDLYQHHSNETRNEFYGYTYDSTVCVLFNDAPSSVKSFGSLSYEGSQSRVLLDTSDGEYYNNEASDGWYASEIITDLETGFIPEFRKKEGKWFNYIRGNKSNNLTNLDVSQFSTQGIGRISAISSDVSTTPGKPNVLMIKDTGDTD